MRLTPRLNLPALGRCQSVYSAFTASHRPVFLLNSQLTLFTVISHGSIHKELHHTRHPLSRSYGARLPSSLTRVRSSTLVYSTCLPVSDCGTVTEAASPNGFSWQLSLHQFASAVALAPHFLYPSLRRATDLDRDIQSPDGLTSCVTIDVKRHFSGSRMLTACPSPTPCWP